MAWFFYLFYALFLIGLSESTNQFFDLLQIISFLVYINRDLPSYLEIFLISLFYFQKGIFPSIGDQYNEETDERPAYHQYYSNTIIDQNPYERISERLGITSSYLLNGLGLIYLSLLSHIAFFCISKI
jgi:hypothetical protein